MITVKSIDEEINECLNLRMMQDVKAAQLSKAANRIEFLKTVKMYIQSEPTEAFCKKELDRLESRVTKLQGDYPVLKNCDRKTQTAKIKEYEKELGIPALKLQIKTLRFILNN